MKLIDTHLHTIMKQKHRCKGVQDIEGGVWMGENKELFCMEIMMENVVFAK